MRLLLQTESTQVWLENLCCPLPELSSRCGTRVKRINRGLMQTISADRVRFSLRRISSSLTPFILVHAFVNLQVFKGSDECNDSGYSTFVCTRKHSDVCAVDCVTAHFVGFDSLNTQYKFNVPRR